MVESGRIEGAEGEDELIGRPGVLTNPDPREIPETEPLTRQHIHSRSQSWNEFIFMEQGLLVFQPRPCTRC